MVVEVGPAPDRQTGVPGERGGGVGGRALRGPRVAGGRGPSGTDGEARGGAVPGGGLVVERVRAGPHCPPAHDAPHAAGAAVEGKEKRGKWNSVKRCMENTT